MKTDIKRNQIIDRVRRLGQSNRLELANTLRISNSRVCSVVDTMIDDALLIEDCPRRERRGRAGVSLRVNSAHGYVAGFDIEAKCMRLVVIDFAGQIIWQIRESLDASLERKPLIECILNFIEHGVTQARLRYDSLLGIGLAACGLVDVRRGVILKYNLIPAMRDLPLRDLVTARVDLPCIMENNIRALTMAEWMNGAGRPLHSFVCLAVRSGIGAGIVIDGRLLSGVHGFAGEVGDMNITNASGPHRKLSEFVSEHALMRDAETSDFEISASRAKRAGSILGAQIASIACVLDPQAIILAGPLVKLDGPLWPSMNDAFRQMALSELAERVQLLPAQLGPFAAASGAAHHCLNMLHPTTTTYAMTS